MKQSTYFLECCATFALSLICCSCGKDSLSADAASDNLSYELGHEQIVLGSRLDNPYTVENVKSALKALYPGTKAASSVDVTDLYVRFLPEDDAALDKLAQLGVTLLDHPMDYSIIKEGDWYHDPDVDEEKITWQYAVVPADFQFPQDIKYEMIDECYLAEHDPATKTVEEVDWDAVERQSFILTGNADMLSAGTKGGGVEPSGRITITDADANGGQPVGVAGVKVQCNVFIKFASAFTDSEGYYKIPKKFSANPRYRLVFENSRGFTIGFNWILYKGSISTIGKNPPEGVSVAVDRNSERKLFRRCCVNNSAWEYYERCSEGDLNLQAPHNDICFWCFEDLDASSAVMLHHGTILDGESSNTIYRIVSAVVKYFSPDITLGTRNLASYNQIYSAVVHELAHASHFYKVGTDYWNKYIMYIVKCALAGGDTYGDGSIADAGTCCVGEMWAYYLENRFYKDRYGKNPGCGSSYWFHPQILTSLQDRGMSPSQIFAAFQSDVTDKNSLKQRLQELYPYKSSMIAQIFNRYD